VLSSQSIVPFCSWYIQGVNAKRFYLLLYFNKLRTLLFSPLGMLSVLSSSFLILNCSFVQFCNSYTMNLFSSEHRFLTAARAWVPFYQSTYAQCWAMQLFWTFKSLKEQVIKTQLKTSFNTIYIYIVLLDLVMGFRFYYSFTFVHKFRFCVNTFVKWCLI